LPTLAELMPAVRGALPVLKLTMHVYSADPAGRFVLIDGKRLVQGDGIGASLTLSEIRRDGAVLDYAGKRFLVPRP
jgi:general secretion pathway protein B